MKPFNVFPYDSRFARRNTGQSVPIIEYHRMGALQKLAGWTLDEAIAKAKRL